MSTPQTAVVGEINGAMAALVECGLVDDQNFAYQSQTGSNSFVVRYSNFVPFGPVLRNSAYEKNYREQRRSRAFNFLMLDGAMVQMVYEFSGGELVRHRLAFLPSPDLLEYQNHPDLYAEEVLYADVVDKRVVSVPLRFDYDARDHVVIPLDHPSSHLTLGQYSGCRIPVAAGVTPHAFTEFILRSFYRLASSSVAVALPAPLLRFDPCLHDSERRVVHVGVPTHL